jgi:hypothetical protein
MDEPERMGLDDRVANFVIAAYALMDNRILVQSGQTIEPDVQRLDATVEIRTQRLPSEEEWEAVRPHAQSIFGVDASPIRNAANVSRLIDAVKEVARMHAEAARALVKQLGEVTSKVGANADSDRLRTAHVGSSLLDRVLSANDVDAVSVLADVEPPTSAAALGRSIMSAQQVVGAVQRARWEVFGTVADLPGEWAAEGARIRDAVREALEHDELSQALPPVLDREDTKATRLLQAAATKPSPPQQKSPQPEPGHGKKHRLPAQGFKSDLSGDEATEVLQELLERREKLARLTVTWEFSD